MRQLLNPWELNIVTKGKVFYNDGRRRLDLKRPIRDFLPKGRIFYVMELHLSKEKTVQRAIELINKGTMPILLYFREENEVS